MMTEREAEEGLKHTDKLQKVDAANYALRLVLQAIKNLKEARHSPGADRPFLDVQIDKLEKYARFINTESERLVDRVCADARRGLTPRQEAALSRVAVLAKRQGGEHREELGNGAVAYAVLRSNGTIEIGIFTGVPGINIYSENIRNEL